MITPGKVGGGVEEGVEERVELREEEVRLRRRVEVEKERGVNG